MRPTELARLVRVRRPPAPYGVRRLARVHSVDDLRRLAQRRLPAAVRGYLEGGGEDEHSLRGNRRAFDTVEIIPRILRDVHTVDTSTTVLGDDLPLPIALAPVGAPGLVHPEGELAAARAADRHGIPLAVSTLASTPLERIAGETSAPLWFSLYVWGDRDEARDLIARAKDAGYHALIVTADVTVRSKRKRELRAGLTLPSPSLGIGTVLDAARHPAWTWRFATAAAPTFPNLARTEQSADRSIDHLFDGTLTWDDLAWIRDEWRGALAVKGILSTDDARTASSVGADAIIVSNHGGRQLDHVPAAIDVLPEIAGAVGGATEVLFDSGIRRGTDIVVALARGARAVLIGRAYLYGLAAAGEAGVSHAIDLLADELRRAMALAGCASLDEVSATQLRRTAP
jgi:L-lactate dehydrogenase (cytochrome)